MNSNTDKIREYFDSVDLSFVHGDFSSILELLEWNYLEQEPVRSGEIQCKLKKLHGYFSHLSPQEDDEVFGLIIDLCVAHQARGFRRGFQLGMGLAAELADTE